MHDLVTILAVDDLSMAYLAKSHLAAAGIPCFLQNEYMVGVNWMYANALGGICLQVPAAVAEEALAVLAGEGQFTKLAANIECDEEIDNTGCSAQDESEDDKENDTCTLP